MTSSYFSYIIFRLVISNFWNKSLMVFFLITGICVSLFASDGFILGLVIIMLGIVLPLCIIFFQGTDTYERMEERYVKKS